MTECIFDAFLLIYEFSSKAEFVLFIFLGIVIGLEIWVDLRSDFCIVWFNLFCLQNYTTLLLQRKLLYWYKCKFLFKS